MKFQSALLRLFGSNVLLTVANLGRDVSVATMFGAATKSDVFFLAISIPVFFSMANGTAFRSVAVPALGRAVAAGEGIFAAVAQRLILINTFGILAVAGVLGVTALIAWAAIRGAPQSTTSAMIPLLIAILPMYVMASVVEAIQGPLQVRGHFLAPGLLRLGLPVGIIAGAAMSGGTSIYSTAVGGTIAALSALGMATFFLSKEKMLPGRITRPLPEDIRYATVDGYRALILSNLIAGANPIINQWLASPLGPGAISQVGYANRLIVGIAALVLAALGPLLLIQFSKYVSAGDAKAIKQTYNQFTRATFWLGSLATLTIWLTSDLVIGLLYQRGAFNAADTRIVTQLMNIFALQLPFYWSGISGGMLVCALSLNSFFVVQGIILVAVNFVGSLLLMRVIGVHGLALSTVIVGFAGFAMLQGFLIKYGHVELSRRELFEAVGSAALLTACGLCIWSFHLRIAPDSTRGQIAAGVMMLAAVATVTWLLARAAFRGRGLSIHSATDQ
jgi:putative peptidoglycan lipid II flippase